MRWTDDGWWLSATDLARFAACPQLLSLERELALGLRAAPPSRTTAEREVRHRRAHEREAAVLDRLGAQAGEIRRIPEVFTSSGDPDWPALERLTEAAMAQGARVIHRAALVGGRWRGRADLLLRRDDRPGRWAWSYDVAGIGYSRRVTFPALAPLAVHAHRVAELQGAPPENLIVITADGEQVLGYQDCAAPAERLQREVLAHLDDPPPTGPEPVPQCARCRWLPLCRGQREETDHLSLVAGLRPAQAAALRRAGLTTATALATAPPHELPDGVPARLVEQARLQVRARRVGTLPHHALAPEPGCGLALLPRPSPGDVFFDIEGDPFVDGRGLEYLFGVVEQGEFTGFWAVRPQDQQVAFEALVDHLIAAWDRDPDMHVYHYADYERGRLQALSSRFDTRVEQVRRLLAGGRLIDLYVVVKQGVLVGTPSYSLKKLEPLYWGHGRDGEPVSDALGSVIEFEAWLADGDPARLEAIRSYNEQDCRSTQALRDWLEQVRAEAGGDSSFARPPAADDQAARVATAEPSRTRQPVRTPGPVGRVGSEPAPLTFDALLERWRGSWSTSGIG